MSKPLLLLLLAGLAAGSALAAETLPNGLALPSPWPPRQQPITVEPPGPPPYLLAPPAVIPVDLGRQLFVDYFLVADTDLHRTAHTPEYFPGNPVIAPDRPWEKYRGQGMAMSFSDGVWYDPASRLFQAWYMSGQSTTSYATSGDGVHWDKPALDVHPGTNIVQEASRDSSIVWRDAEEIDPTRRYKMVHGMGNYPGGRPFGVYYSADGIHWRDSGLRTPPVGDRTTAFWNPFRRVWVFSIRAYAPRQQPPAFYAKFPFHKQPGDEARIRSYHEGSDLAAAATWKPEEAVPWVGADRLDATRIDLGSRPELYTVDAVAYESVMLGFFTIWRGQYDRAVRDKPNQVSVGFSRDGFHWDRPFRSPFLPISEQKGAWNYANVQSVGGLCLVVGDRLFFYMSGRTAGQTGPGTESTGLATLRRDGFISMDAGEGGGTLTTRPLRFHGRHLFVNADSSRGELKVEVLDAAGSVLPPYGLAECAPLRSDNTLQEVTWQGAADLGSLAGRPVRFRFHLRAGSLYAFWVSPDSSGASHGYVAAGGPGFTGPTDTVGKAIYETGTVKQELN